MIQITEEPADDLLICINHFGLSRFSWEFVRGHINALWLTLLLRKAANPPT